MKKYKFDIIIPIYNEGISVIKLLKLIKTKLKKKNLMSSYVMIVKKITYLNILKI